MNSQNISTEDKRVKTFINEKGDTLVQMSHQDAKTLLTDVLKCEITDSILSVYILRDSLNSKTVSMQTDVIAKLYLKEANYETMISNLNQILANKDKEISLKDEIIKQQNKEIKKQKFYKNVAIIGGIVGMAAIFVAGM